MSDLIFGQMQNGGTYRIGDRFRAACSLGVFFGEIVGFDCDSGKVIGRMKERSFCSEYAGFLVNDISILTSDRNKSKE